MMLTCVGRHLHGTGWAAVTKLQRRPRDRLEGGAGPR